MSLLGLLLLLAAADTTPNPCADCEAWNRPHPPFRIYGNTYYVGVTGLSSVLIDGGDGLILIDGALPQSAERILESVGALGFDPHKVRWILNSHAHFDHAGGIAALQRTTGARVGASPAGARALQAGNAAPDDPQATPGTSMRYPPVQKVEPIADGATIHVGSVTVTAHHTAGHTPGGTTWTWRSCEGKRCVEVVFADSLTAISAPGFRYSADAARVARFEKSIATIGALPCDILVPTHPSASHLFEQLARSERDGREAFVEPGACRAYAARGAASLTQRLKEEGDGKQK
jgi:metallo-beta-lactamase class B